MGQRPEREAEAGQKASEAEASWVEFEVDAKRHERAPACGPFDRAAKHRSPTLRLKDEVQQAIEVFKGKPAGRLVADFEGDWSYTSDAVGEPQEAANNKVIKAGKSPADAARAIITPRRGGRRRGHDRCAGAVRQAGEGRGDRPMGYTSVRRYAPRLTLAAAEHGAARRCSGVDRRLDLHDEDERQGRRRAALVVMGASITLNWLIDSGNEKVFALKQLALEEAQLPQGTGAGQDARLPAALRGLGRRYGWRCRSRASRRCPGAAATRAPKARTSSAQPVADVNSRSTSTAGSSLPRCAELGEDSTPWRRPRSPCSPTSPDLFQKAQLQEWGCSTPVGCNCRLTRKR